MEEIWKDIKDFEGLYQISSRGNVRSLDRTDNNNHFKKERNESRIKMHEN